MTWLRYHFTQLGTYAAHPAAFSVVIVFGILWFFFEPDTFNWHALASLATLLVALFIQRSGHRDTQAIHAKLDELLRSDPAAKAELARLDDEEPEEIEKFRRATQGTVGEPDRTTVSAGAGKGAEASSGGKDGGVTPGGIAASGG